MGDLLFLKLAGHFLEQFRVFEQVAPDGRAENGVEGLLAASEGDGCGKGEGWGGGFHDGNIGWLSAV